MAIQGTFLADFTQFEGATRSATKTLQDFEGTSKKVETTLDGMTTAAPVGIKKVTESAVQADSALLSMGRTAASIAGAFGVVFSVGAVVNFGREIFRTADELQKLSDRTGIGVGALQAFKVAGDEAGNTIEQLARASATLQDRLASGDTSAVRAVERLGLSLEQLRSLSPEEQLIAISDAIRQIGDSGDQIRLVNDLFGRMGVEILPTVKRGFDEARDASLGMSAAAVGAIDRLGDAFTRFRTQAAAGIGEEIGRALLGFEEGLRIIDVLLGRDTGQLKAMTEAATAAAPKMEAVAPPGLPEDLAAIEAELTKNAQALIEVNKWAEQTAVAYQKLMSTVANEEGLAQMKEVEETMKRQAQNQEGLWLMERDAWQLQMAERAKQVEQEKAFADDLQKQNEAGLTIIGEMSDAVTVFGDATIASTEAAAAGFQGVASAANQAGQAIQNAIQPTIDWAQAYKDAGLFVQSSPFLGTSLLSQQNRNLSSLQALTVNSNVNVSGVWDTNAQESIRSAVSDSVTRAVLQGRKVAA